MHDQNQNWSRISSIKLRYRMCRCCSRPSRSYSFGKFKSKHPPLYNSLPAVHRRLFFTLTRNTYFRNFVFHTQDGGCTCAGDVAKAFGAGADFVMIGGMFAGHDQSGGELTVKPNGNKVKSFYGMSSNTAMLKHAGRMANYRYLGA